MENGTPYCWKRGVRVLLVTAWVFFAAPILLLAVLECGLRIAGYGSDTRYLVRLNGFVLPNKAFHQQFFSLPVDSLMDWDVAEFMTEVSKPPGARRVVILGESAAYGSPFGGYSFSRYLERMLREAFPGARIEVINAAVPGTNSNVLQVMASCLAQLEPDVFLLYMGNNESNPPFASPGLSSMLPFISRPALFRAEVALNRLRLVQAARSFRHEQAPPLVWPNEDSADNLALNDFEANLGVIRDEAKHAGAKLLLCTLGRNAAEDPAAMSVADIAAIPRSSFNKRILSFARRAPVDLLRLVDVDRACWEYSGRIAPPGYDLFCDLLHFTFDGNYLLAATVFPHTAALLEEGGCRRAGTGPLSQVECERRMGLGPSRKLSLVEPDPGAKLAPAGASTARLRQQAGPDPRQAMESDFRTALRLNPEDWVLRVQYLRWLLESDDIQGAQRESAEIIKRFPKLRAANRLLARTLERAGDMEGARRAYMNTLALYPDDRLSRQALQQLRPVAPGPENGS